MIGFYVLVARTGFCDSFVQSIHPSAQHLRHTSHRERAVRFRTSDEARRHRRSGEELVWRTEERKT